VTFAPTAWTWPASAPPGGCGVRQAAVPVEPEQVRLPSHEEPPLLTLWVDRPLDWMDLARLFEPEAEERADVSAALRKGFLRLKEPLRSPVPPRF